MIYYAIIFMDRVMNMYTNENTIKLFDANNNFVADFDKKIEEVEISIHGENYYDVDEELVNTYKGVFYAVKAYKNTR